MWDDKPDKEDGDSWDKAMKEFNEEEDRRLYMYLQGYWDADPTGLYESQYGKQALSEAPSEDDSLYDDTDDLYSDDGLYGDDGDDGDSDSGDWESDDGGDGFGDGGDGGDDGDDDSLCAGYTDYETETGAEEEFDEGKATPLETRVHEAKKRIKDFERYGAASDDDRLEYKRAKLIVKGGCMPAKYMSCIYGFCLVEAAMDNIDIPKEFIDFYEIDDAFYEFYDNLRDYDPELAIKVFDWLYREFSPYAEYDERSIHDMLKHVLFCYTCDDEDREPTYGYVKKNAGMIGDIIRNLESLPMCGDYILDAVEKGDIELAKGLFRAVTENRHVKLNKKADFAETVFGDFKYMQSIKGIKLCLSEFLPILGRTENDILKKKITKWKDKLKEALEYLEEPADEENGEDKEEEEPEDGEEEESSLPDWREIYKNGTLDPSGYKDEDEYLAALRKRKEEAIEAGKEVIRKINKLLDEIKEEGRYAESFVKKDKKFNLAFYGFDKKTEELCREITKPYGGLSDFGKGYLIASGLPGDNLQRLYMLALISGEMRKYTAAKAETNGGNAEDGGDTADINKPLMEYLYDCDRSLKLKCLDLKAVALNCRDEKPAKRARFIWMSYDASARNDALYMYAELKCLGRLRECYAPKLSVFEVVKRHYPDAVSGYKEGLPGKRYLDVYIPELKTGIDYRGIQYYHAIDILGGENRLDNCRKLSAEKEAACRKLGIRLIVWKYDEEFTDKVFLEKIK